MVPFSSHLLRKDTHKSDRARRKELVDFFKSNLEGYPIPSVAHDLEPRTTSTPGNGSNTCSSSNQYVNGNGEKLVLTAVSLQPDVYNNPLATPIWTLLEEWHKTRGASKKPPVATGATPNTIRPYKVYGPSGSEYLPIFYRVKSIHTTYVIVVLHRPGLDDAAVRYTGYGSERGYYSIWHGGNTIDQFAAAVRIVQNSKGKFPFILEQHAAKFGLSEGRAEEGSLLSTSQRGMY